MDRAMLLDFGDNLPSVGLARIAMDILVSLCTKFEMFIKRVLK